MARKSTPETSIASPMGPPRSPPFARLSPGLLAGHYAGGKWAEPPLPSSLPSPPMEWTSPLKSALSSIAPVISRGNHRSIATIVPLVVVHQANVANLKMLLNVRA